ncbi:hypothetical protein CRYUN_Cryun25bG0060000 [Craigia yunnanensis]
MSRFMFCADKLLWRSECRILRIWKQRKEVEAIVRENGAVPATIAILDGMRCVGLYS